MTHATATIGIRPGLVEDGKESQGCREDRQIDQIHLVAKTPGNPQKMAQNRG